MRSAPCSVRALVGLACLAVLAGALGGCVQAVAALVAPEAAAAASSVSAAGDAIAGSFDQAGAASLAADPGTLTDIDRILATMPDDSPQRADLEAMRGQVGTGPLAGVAPMQQHFLSDPERDLDLDHRKEADATAVDRHRAGHGFLVHQDPGGGHRLVLEQPRRIGADPPPPHEAPHPFTIARESDLQAYEPRYYGTSMPSLPDRPSPVGVDRHDRD